MEDSISIRRAMSQLFGSTRFLLVFGAFFVSDLTSHIGRRWPALVISLLFGLVVGGYSISMSHAVARSDSPLPSPLGGLKDHARRGIATNVLTLVLSLAAIPILLILGAGATLFDFLEWSVPTPFIVVAAVVLGFAATSVLIPALAGYVAYDRLSPALRIGRSLRLAWNRKRLLAVPVTLTASFALVSLGASYVFARILHAPGPWDSGEALGAAMSGHANTAQLAVAGGIVTLSLAGALVGLLSAHLLGQYTRLLYFDVQEGDVVGLTSASTPTPDGIGAPRAID